MNVRLFGCLVGIVIFLSVSPQVRAEYVLPYPSAMPGNKLYRIMRIIDELKKPLYFGSITRYKYHLSLADKYLVEAKTLFEYKQYLLAVDALERSDREFQKATPILQKASAEGKDVRLFVAQYLGAIGEHTRVLSDIRAHVPETFTWTPEKTDATKLPLSSLLTESLRIREEAKQALL